MRKKSMAGHGWRPAAFEGLVIHLWLERTLLKLSWWHALNNLCIASIAALRFRGSWSTAWWCTCMTAMMRLRAVCFRESIKPLTPEVQK